MSNQPENHQQCKGFWNMCSCERCREADRKLDAASKEDKKVASEQAKVHLERRAKPMSYQTEDARKVSLPHWYETWTYECPSCGRVRADIERHYGDSPPPKEKRYRYKQVWCGGCYE